MERLLHRSLRGSELSCHKMLRNSIFGGRLIQKDLRRRVVFQEAVQKVQSVERDQAMTCVGVLTPVLSEGRMLRHRCVANCVERDSIRANEGIR